MTSYEPSASMGNQDNNLQQNAVGPQAVETSAGETEERRTYIFETYTDRERLYAQYGIAKDQFNAWLKQALIKGQLSSEASTANWRLLDAGCGEGLYSADVLDHYPHVEVVGVDRDLEGIMTATMFASPKGKAHFFQHNLLNPLPTQFEANSNKTDSDDSLRVDGQNFDVVLAWYVLMHLKPAEQGLANIAKTLKPGGIIILNDAVEKWATFPHPSFELLVNLITNVGRRIASLDFGERHNQALSELGFEEIESTDFDAPLGGASVYGQRIFSHVIASLEAARAGLVDSLKVISAEEFDRHIRLIKTETTTEQEGHSRSLVTIARKPL